MDQKTYMDGYIDGYAQAKIDSLYTLDKLYLEAKENMETIPQATRDLEANLRILESLRKKMYILNK